MRLDLSPNLADPDAIYQSLIDLHEGRDDGESAAINARLIFLLINHIGDQEVIREAMEMAATAREISETCNE